MLSKEHQVRIENLKTPEIHKLFKNGNPLTDEQLAKFDRLLEAGWESVAIAYLDFCFNQGKPLTDEQIRNFVKFLEMGWEDVATAYLNLCINGSVNLEFSKENDF